MDLGHLDVAVTRFHSYSKVAAELLDDTHQCGPAMLCVLHAHEREVTKRGFKIIGQTHWDTKNTEDPGVREVHVTSAGMEV